MSSKLVKESESHPLARGAEVEDTNLRGPDSRSRSLIKALSWRVTAFAVTVSIVWVATGEARFAAGVGIADALFKISLYYLHERAWNRSTYGRASLQKII